MKKPTIYPPHVLLASLLAMIGLHKVVPVYQWLHGSKRRIGFLPLIGGFVLGAIGSRQITQQMTTIRPFEESSALLTDGLYRYSRNPIYVGMLLMLDGVSLLLGSVTPLVVPPLFAGVITQRFIKVEEQMLAERFGAQYEAYRQRTRRWL